VYFWKMIYQIPRRHNSRSVLLDPENVGVVVGISSLSCTQVEIFVTALCTSDIGGHL